MEPIITLTDVIIHYASEDELYYSDSDSDEMDYSDSDSDTDEH